MNIVHLSNLCLFQVKVVTGKDGQAVTPVAIATQLPPNVSAAFSVQQQFQVIEATLVKALITVKLSIISFLNSIEKFYCLSFTNSLRGYFCRDTKELLLAP